MASTLPRKNYARIPVKLGLPNLIDIQLDFLNDSRQKGLAISFMKSRP